MSTVMQDAYDTESGNDEDGAFKPANSKPHRRQIKTGDYIPTPFNILKSEQLVSTVVRNNITPTAVAATVHALVEACRGDPSKLNFHPSQAYR